MTSSELPPQKCGFIAVIGAPNAGKSTFVNHMVGAKVSIVTHKVQTTRARVRGVAIHDEAQIVYVDTPGIFKPRRKLDKAMVSAAWEGADNVDALLLMVDAPSFSSYLNGEDPSPAAEKSAADVELIMEGLKRDNKRAVVVLNKIDLMPRQRLLKLTEYFSETQLFDEIFMISAEKGYGTEEIKSYLLSKIPNSPWMYPEDQLSDISDRLMAAEITREKLFLRLHQELPYSLTVETESWTRNKKKELRVEQVIFIERDSQKALVLGQRGQTIKLIGQMAREEMQEIFGEKVHLFLFVKVRANWSDDPARYREMGLQLD